MNAERRRELQSALGRVSEQLGQPEQLTPAEVRMFWANLLALRDLINFLEREATTGQVRP